MTVFARVAPLAAWLSRCPPLAPHAETLALTIVVTAIAFLALIAGELVPKRLALASLSRR
jgi:putative hemolysin